MVESKNKKSVQIILLGASYSTGNLGVSALAWSSMYLIRNKWPEARISILGADRQFSEAQVRLEGPLEAFQCWPVRFCLNVFAPHHILGLWLLVGLCRFSPKLQDHLGRSDSTLGVLLRCDLICDITGGDSFSDLYGVKRLLYVFLLKTACQLTGKSFILLPQTYGPFAKKFSRLLARRVLRNATMIYSRDREGVHVVRELIGVVPPVRLCPDVAFVLKPIRPNNAQVRQVEAFRMAGEQVLGLNISGLLYNGGYSHENMFGLASDYRGLTADILKEFCRMPGWRVLLVPHVLPGSNYAVEDDHVAAEKVFEALPKELKQRVVILERGYDQNETKFCIGLCDFFIGARMHATIAALSQAVPAVGLAYSRKFEGVFATAGVADCVLDLRTLSNEHVLQRIWALFERRQDLCQALQRTIPILQRELLTMFDMPGRCAIVNRNLK